MNLLQHKVCNGWPLFWLIAALTFVAMLLGVVLIGVSTPEAAVSMIRLSVQLASPWVFLAFVATPLTRLFPGHLSKWLLRNRRYIGLSFAAGFGWQAVFIGALLALHNAYYWEELHNATDLFLRIVSFIFLFALTITSFFPIRRRMAPGHWRVLHWVGIWYFWAAIWATYAGQALHTTPRLIDFVFAVVGLLVLGIRVVAWWKTRAGEPIHCASELGVKANK